MDRKYESYAKTNELHRYIDQSQKDPRYMELLKTYVKLFPESLNIISQFRDQTTNDIPLFHSIRIRNIPATKILLECCNNYNVRDKDGSPLIVRLAYIINNDNIDDVIECIHLILDQHGININMGTSGGTTTLEAVISKMIDGMNTPRVEIINIVKLFLEKGADPNILTFCKVSLLAFTINKLLVNLVDISKSIGIIKFLLSNGADPNKKFKNGMNTLTYLCTLEYSSQLSAIIKFLLCPDTDPKCEIDALDDDKKTALMYAIIKSDPDADLSIVKLLLDHGANIELKDSNGSTALLIAARQSNIETMCLLINHGANIQAMTSNETSFFDIIFTNKELTPADRLLVCKLLIEKKIDINFELSKGFTLFMHTVSHSKSPEGLELVNLIIEHLANTNSLDHINKINKGGWFPLMHAAGFASSTGSFETVKLLISHGADPKLNTHYGNALFASLYADIEITKYFIDLGTDINHCDKNGNSILMYLISNKEIENEESKIRFLLVSGINIGAVNHAGKTAYDMADSDAKTIIKEHLLNTSICQIPQSDDTCSICLVEHNLNIRFGCGHVFHFMCVYKWLDCNRTCPMCRGILY